MRHAGETSLVEFAKSGDIDGLSDLLRWGPFLTSDAHCRLPNEDRLTQMAWHRVLRMPPPNPDMESPIKDLLNALAGAATGFAVAVTRNSNSRPRLLIGVRERSIAGWLRSLLAPAVILEPSGPPEFYNLAARFAGGLSFRLFPGLPDDKSTEPQASALERLLLVPESAWCVWLDVQPVAGFELDQMLADLGATQSELALLGAKQVQQTPTEAMTVDRPDVDLARMWIMALHDLASTARAIGGWRVTTYVAASDGWALNMAGGAIVTSLVERGVKDGRWLCDRLGIRQDGPLSNSFLSSRELELILRPPRRSVPGLEISPSLPSGRDIAHTPKPLPLGRWFGLDDNFDLDLEDLEGHVFVAGVTGTGKTNTVQKLLIHLWNDHRIPFLVIDPVKSDYEAMADMIDGGLEIVDADELRLNALEPAPDFDARTHLELVAAAFKGSFSMPPPVPYVVTHLFEQMGERIRYQPRPTLHDLSGMADEFIRSLGYDREIESNIRAALVNRLRVLVAPARAERLAAPTSKDLPRWLTKPTTIQLARLGDDEERAFIMALLTILVGESARMAESTDTVRHVTVLEEAHRVLPEPRNVAVSEWAGDPGSVAARLLSQMLTEIRGYGECIIVVDQSPSSVAREVVKNTNLRIAHRVLDPDDRALLGGSLGLELDATLGMARLPRGVALIATRRAAEPYAVQVDRVPEGNRRSGGKVLHPPTGTDARLCCGGVIPTLHHESELRVGEAENVMSGPLTAALVTPKSDTGYAYEVARGELQRLVTRYPRTDQRCLAWIGLRAALTSHAQLGNLEADQVGEFLSHAYAAWSAGEPMHAVAEQLHLRSKKMFGPFAGCVFCDYRCRFRQFALSRKLFGRSNAATALAAAAPHETGEAGAHWISDAQRELADRLGAGPARGAAICSMVHALDGMDAPWATYELAVGGGAAAGPDERS